MSKVRVLCVDDSALMRGFLRATLSADPAIEVVGTAADAFHARTLIKQLDPDVLVLDIEMPDMSGIEFLDRLMRLRPMPVVMFSSTSDKSSDLGLQALALGAIDVIAKPACGRDEAWSAAINDLIETIKTASAAQVSFNDGSPLEAYALASRHRWPAGRIVAIGASTGGVQALRTFIPELPIDCPPILIAQHMPAGFTRSFAQRLDSCSRIDVCEAFDGLAMRPGLAVIAPGDHHLIVERRASECVCRIDPGDGTGSRIRPMPSADRLFDSLAETIGSLAVGIVLTGMGKDGAAGLETIRRAGGITASQDEASSQIFGMPKVAAQTGAARYEVELRHMAAFIMEAPAKGRPLRLLRDDELQAPKSQG